MRYKFINLDTQHLFYESDNLKHVIAFYHKVPRRKRHTLAIVDTTTGELLKVKAPRTPLHDQ